MKKTFALLLAIIMLFSLASCGGSTPAPQGNNGNASQTPAAPSNTENDKTPSTPVKEPETKNAYTIADHVIIDNDVCKVTVVSATTPKSGGVTFK
ncbi:MAG: hypothetical protein II185_00605, partial [Firmicutes bacterium]|nr:hypothetical protein [Bacillota bacterium]